MDTTEQYIKMWLASGLEIEPDGFQPWVCPHCNLILTPTMANAYSIDPGMKNRHFCPDFMDRGYASTKVKPLARQDQLWEKLPNKDYSLWGKNDFTLWKGNRKISNTCKSAEQALIQGVMYELYGKKWIDEKWEIVKEEA